ncbi:MAG: hypothetical protein KF736_14015 [Acidobacteria bacterium]|nr:hypothetical protein [Acidobacteriota bacterium]MCW5950284.1 hypothetical protein [Pyrinomonadaceae bacterium]
MEILVARQVPEVQNAFERLRRSAAIGCDTETSGLDPDRGKLYSIQFSDGELGVLIPLSEGVAMGPFSELLADEAIVKIFHNARFDIEFLGAAGVSVRNVFDTMIAEKVLTRGAGQSASLAETLYRHFGIDLDKSLRAKFTRNWNGVWTDELVDYALSDVFHLPRLMAAQSDWLARLGLTDEFTAQQERLGARSRRLTSDGTPDGPL